MSNWCKSLDPRSTRISWVVPSMQICRVWPRGCIWCHITSIDTSKSRSCSRFSGHGCVHTWLSHFIVIRSLRNDNLESRFLGAFAREWGKLLLCIEKSTFGWKQAFEVFELLTVVDCHSREWIFELIVLLDHSLRSRSVDHVHRWNCSLLSNICPFKHWLVYNGLMWYILGTLMI
jgi:hypothetical protein